MAKAQFLPQSEIARLAASMFLEIDAVKFAKEEPFTLTSGRKSPVYVDGRKLIAFPRLRVSLMDLAAGHILSHCGFESLEAIAGGETAGIPFAAWIAERLSLPMLYVRKKPKGFGRNAQIEGHFREGDRVLLVEDLATDGGSKLLFVEALRKAGAEVSQAFVIFYYDTMKGALESLQKEGIELTWLVTWWDLLEAAKASGRFTSEQLQSAESFLKSPEDWKP